MDRMGEYQDRALADAVTRVVDAGERFVAVRMELLRAEGARVAVLSVAAFVGAALGLLGWIALMAAAVVALRPLLSPAASLTIVGGAHFVVGLAVASVAARRLLGRGLRPAAPEPVEDPRLRAHVE